jgi:hypothetical protein
MPTLTDAELARKRRLEQLLELAGVYRGWTRKQLAAALDRDATKVVPESGNPKLDLVVALSDLLDWPVGDVVNALWGDASQGGEETAKSFGTLEDEIVALHRAGKYQDVLKRSPALLGMARNAQERAIARIREYAGWDGLGRYSKGIEVLRAGLAESPISRGARLVLESNLALAYYSMNYAVEARALAKDLIEYLSEEPPATESERSSHAYAHFVSGQASRLLMASDVVGQKRHAERSIADLAKAESIYKALFEEFNDQLYAGQARTSRLGALEARVLLGQVQAADAVKGIMDDLDAVVDLDQVPGADLLDSYCWSCIFGANIALRHLPDRDMNRTVAILTNKGYELAERLNNWSLREKLFTLEFLQRQRVTELIGTPLEWTIDSEEVRTIVGAMGRFPSFRQTGWEILRTARVIRQN